jgi:hypothetical protein
MNRRAHRSVAFDYLSTVPRGGYIGAWFAAWILCEGGGPGDPNTAMNLVAGDELAWQERMAESFILSPLYCGSKTTGYRPATRIAMRELKTCQSSRQRHGGLTVARIATKTVSRPTGTTGYPEPEWRQPPYWPPGDVRPGRPDRRQLWLGSPPTLA